MPYRIKGTLKLPATSQVAAGVDIEFISRRNYSPLLIDLSSIIKTSPTGAYDVTLEFGEYAVVLYWGCNQPSHIGKLFVFADTIAGLDLQTLLQQADWQPATPEYIQQIQDWLAQSAASAAQAIESAVAAKISELAAEADRAEVANNKTIVVNAQADVAEKHADVVDKSAQVAANTAIVNEKTPLAVAAADTASQKAVEAATDAATASDAATRAENAALAMTGAILDGGQCDLSSGFYPPALEVGGKKYSTVWYVQVGGTVAGTKYDAGDKLQYTTANDGFYFRIDARDDVVSVNGEKGAVVLTAQKVGADPEGAAAAIMSQHKAEPDAHSPQNVGADPVGTAETLVEQHKSSKTAHKPQDVGADPAGTAETLVNQHKTEAHAHTPQNVGADPEGSSAQAIAELKAESDPFPQYLTSADIGNLEDRVTELEKRKSTCLVNAAGTGAPHETVVAALPKMINVNTRYVLPNPFGNNTPVIVTAETLWSDIWADCGWVFAGESLGVKASYVQGEGVIVQTGSAALAATSKHGGGGHGNNGNFPTQMPCRVFVRRAND